MDKHTARHDTEREQKERQDEQPTWEKTTPRGNPEVDPHDLNRSAERLEMLLGH